MRDLLILLYYLIRCKKHFTQADVAELVDALDLGSSIFDVRVRVSPSAFYFKNYLLFAMQIN